MARVTVEDCLDKVQNRFELVLVASKRARQLLTTGIDPLVPWGKDKSKDKATVVALREIASGQLDAQHLNEFDVEFEKKPTKPSELFKNQVNQPDEDEMDGQESASSKRNDDKSDDIVS